MTINNPCPPTPENVSGFLLAAARAAALGKIDTPQLLGELASYLQVLAFQSAIDLQDEYEAAEIESAFLCGLNGTPSDEIQAALQSALDEMQTKETRESREGRESTV